MPELPEVQTTKKALCHYLANQTLQSVHIHFPSLRYPIPQEIHQFVGCGLHSIHRVGKYLVFTFEKNRQQMLIHLGMSGSLRVMDTQAVRKKHDHVRFVFTDTQMLYHDPRRFGAIVLTDINGQHRLLNTVGVEPMIDEIPNPKFNAKWLYQICQKTKRPIKTVLMDNAIIAGVGNIYANESLYLAGIHPKIEAANISEQKLSLLVDKVIDVLTKAIQAGGTTLRDFVSGNAKAGYFSQQLLVYAQSQCKICGTEIQKIHIGQRASYYCPTCQLLP